MSRVLTGSISRRMPARLELLGREAQVVRRRSRARARASTPVGVDAGEAVELRAAEGAAHSRWRGRRPPGTRRCGREGRRCRARLASQLPAGRLCSTWTRPLRSRRCGEVFASGKHTGTGTRRRQSRPRAAASKRSRKSMLVVEHGQVGAELGHASLAQLFASRAGAMAVGACALALSELLELDDLVDLGAHGDVRHPLEDHFDDHRHLVLASSRSAPARKRAAMLVRLGARGSPCSRGPRRPRHGRRRSR